MAALSDLLGKLKTGTATSDEKERVLSLKRKVESNATSD